MGEIKQDINEKDIAIIKTSETLGKGELYWHFFECPNCKKQDVIHGYKYCPVCGIEINWIADEILT